MAMKDNALIYWDQTDPVFTVFIKRLKHFLRSFLPLLSRISVNLWRAIMR